MVTEKNVFLASNEINDPALMYRRKSIDGFCCFRTDGNEHVPM